MNASGGTYGIPQVPGPLPKKGPYGAPKAPLR